MFRIWRIAKLINDTEDELVKKGPKNKHAADVYIELIVKDMISKYGYDEHTIVKILRSANASGYIKIKSRIASTGEDLSSCYVTEGKGYRLISGPSGFINEAVNTYSGFATILLSSLATTLIIAAASFIMSFYHWTFG